jgi:hypothetical protein
MRVLIHRPAERLPAASVGLSSRNHKDFPAILSEISRNSRYFCIGRRGVSPQAFESVVRLIDQ